MPYRVWGNRFARRPILHGGAEPPRRTISFGEAVTMQTRREFIIAGVSILGAMTWAACSPAGADKDKAGKEASGVPKNVKVKVFNKVGELVGPIEMPKVVKTDD